MMEENVESADHSHEFQVRDHLKRTLTENAMGIMKNASE